MKYLIINFTALLLFLSLSTALFAQNKDSIDGDFEALQDIYEVTGGEDWTNNSGWSSMTPETMGSAYGVEVWSSGDNVGRVKELFLYDNGLSNIQKTNGEPDFDSRGRYQLETGMALKETLGNLKRMEYIDIRHNTLTGDIPDSFWLLSNLKTAALGYFDQTAYNANENRIAGLDSKLLYSRKGDYTGTKFTGSIPSTVSNMLSLEKLFLERNYFDQTELPKQLFELANLKVIALSNNGFVGSLPNVPLPSGIEYISIKGGSFDRDQKPTAEQTHYYLSGELPPEWGNASNLIRLQITHNDFTGSIPSEWRGMTSMVGLYIDYTGLSGSFPSWLDNRTMPNLNTLYLSRTNLSGNLDPDYDASNMAVLHIGWNSNLTGELPESFKNINHPKYPSKLKILGLSQQNYEGPFMDDLSGLIQIRHVWADNNNFTGPLPLDYPSAKTLAQLYLSGNNFTGALPATIGNMTTPHTILLGSNNLDSYETGAISPVMLGQDGSYISGLRKVRTFKTENNSLSKSDIDQIIIDMWLNVQSRLGTEWENWGGEGVLDISNQSTGAVPSYRSDVNAAITNLTEAGWDVIYDGWENDDRTVELPDAPSLLSPSDKSSNISLTPSFEWEDTGAALYKLEILESSSNEQILIIEQEQTVYTPVTDLEENTLYTWRVRSIDNGLQSDWSASRTFTTLTTNDDTEDPDTETEPRIFPESPLLLGPDNNELNSSITPEFRWAAVEGADYYTLHMSRNSPGGMVIDASVEDTVYTHPEKLGDNSVHHWRVRAVKDGEPGEWSEIFELQTENAGQPQMADLVSPDHFTQNVSVSPNLEWELVDSDWFEIRIIDKVTSETVLTDELSGYQYTPDDPLAEETAYIWQVKNIKDGVEGAWSPRWEFATGEYDYVTSSPLLLSPDNGGEYESLTPTFEWESVEADMYVISVSLEKPSKAKVLSETNKESTIIFEEIPETYYTTEESLDPETTYYWRVKAIKNGEESDWSETWEFTTPVEETDSDDPDETAQQIVLSQNYPNPFNPSTQIEFSISALQDVSLKVYDMAGRQVADLVGGMMPAGIHRVTFRGDRLASGIYFYRLITDSQSYTKKMTLLK